jgi:hypothetical protein
MGQIEGVLRAISTESYEMSAAGLPTVLMMVERIKADSKLLFTMISCSHFPEQ